MTTFDPHLTAEPAPAGSPLGRAATSTSTSASASTSTATPPATRRRQLSLAQQLVVGAAGLPLVGIFVTIMAATFGFISANDMVDVGLALGENPGMFVFAAMMWCTPIQQLTGRTQVPVRKILGIMFAGYALANLGMFAVDEGISESFSEPFLVAGTLALIASIPLLITSGRWAQRKMGMKNWRKLHKLTYFIAAALILHVVLIGEAGIAAVAILLALIARLSPVANTFRAVGKAARRSVDGQGSTRYAFALVPIAMLLALVLGAFGNIGRLGGLGGFGPFDGGGRGGRGGGGRGNGQALIVGIDVDVDLDQTGQIESATGDVGQPAL